MIYGILRLLKLRPRPFYAPWKSLPYYRWRVETYSGIPSHEVGLKILWGHTWQYVQQLLRRK